MKVLRQLSATFLVLGVACAGSDSIGTTGPAARLASQPLASLSSATTLVCSSAATTSYNSSPAFDITPNQYYKNDGIYSTNWIGPKYDSGNLGVDSPVGYYLFTTPFAADEGSVVTGSVLADNGAIVKVNDNLVATAGATVPADNALMSAFQIPTNFSVDAGFLVNEGNVLTVNVYNSASNAGAINPTGTWYCLSITTCKAAPAIANAYLRSIGVSPNSETGKNIISMVAQHMIQGARFSSAQAVTMADPRPCDPGYADQVKAYLKNEFSLDLP